MNLIFKKDSSFPKSVLFWDIVVAFFKPLPYLSKSYLKFCTRTKLLYYKWYTFLVVVFTFWFWNKGHWFLCFCWVRYWSIMTNWRKQRPFYGPTKTKMRTIQMPTSFYILLQFVRNGRSLLELTFWRYHLALHVHV